jgi:hypothetical protein
MLSSEEIEIIHAVVKSGYKIILSYNNFHELYPSLKSWDYQCNIFASPCTPDDNHCKIFRSYQKEYGDLIMVPITEVWRLIELESFI